MDLSSRRCAGCDRDAAGRRQVCVRRATFGDPGTGRAAYCSRHKEADHVDTRHPARHPARDPDRDPARDPASDPARDPASNPASDTRAVAARRPAAVGAAASGGGGDVLAGQPRKAHVRDAGT